jgi:hypothetical protein
VVSQFTSFVLQGVFLCWILSHPFFLCLFCFCCHCTSTHLILIPFLSHWPLPHLIPPFTHPSTANPQNPWNHLHPLPVHPPNLIYLCLLPQWLGTRRHQMEQDLLCQDGAAADESSRNFYIEGHVFLLPPIIFFPS